MDRSPFASAIVTKASERADMTTSRKRGRQGEGD